MMLSAAVSRRNDAMQEYLRTKKRARSGERMVLRVALACLLPVAANGQLPYTNTTFLNGFASDSTIWTMQYSALSTTPPGYLSQTVVLHIWPSDMSCCRTAGLLACCVREWSIRVSTIGYADC